MPDQLQPTEFDRYWQDSADGGYGVDHDEVARSVGLHQKQHPGYRPPRRRRSQRGFLVGIVVVFAALVTLLVALIAGVFDQTVETDGELAAQTDVAETPAAEANDGYEVVERADDSVELRFSSDVLFEFGSDELTDASAGVLADVAARLHKEASGTVVVAGHTDSDAADDFNQDLSERRAIAVRTYLVDAGVALDIEAVGHGETQPVADNDNPDGTPNEAGRAQNRRVTVVYAR